MADINEYDKIASIRQKELLNGEMKPHRFVEKPMMRSLLPNLNGKKVLLIGCGTGEESSFLEKSGAKEIIGIDISEKSVELANKTYSKHKEPLKNSSFTTKKAILIKEYSFFVWNSGNYILV